MGICHCCFISGADASQTNMAGFACSEKSCVSLLLASLILVLPTAAASGDVCMSTEFVGEPINLKCNQC